MGNYYKTKKKRRYIRINGDAYSFFGKFLYVVLLIGFIPFYDYFCAAVFLRDETNVAYELGRCFLLVGIPMLALTVYIVITAFSAIFGRTPDYIRKLFKKPVLGILATIGAIIVAVLLFAFSMADNALLKLDGSVESNKVFSDSADTYSASDISNIHYYIQRNGLGRRFAGYSLRMQLTMSDGERFTFDASDFDYDPRIFMQNMKEISGCESITFGGTDYIDNYIALRKNLNRAFTQSQIQDLYTLFELEQPT